MRSDAAWWCRVCRGRAVKASMLWGWQRGRPVRFVYRFFIKEEVVTAAMVERVIDVVLPMSPGLKKIQFGFLGGSKESHPATGRSPAPPGVGAAAPSF